ncbi:stage II sporulation protein P [Peribacillus asahii]|uniref:stage II sporulation protein P n=1 Tax=Peribacillus asahii TaxID=228899 RepID=UPI0020794E1A|nr:stage II sporulation protein P [Peribacillus asahii]USK61857.1 stage II sporulation protein P [Peribacillus asahii]
MKRKTSEKKIVITYFSIINIIFVGMLLTFSLIAILVSFPFSLSSKNIQNFLNYSSIKNPVLIMMLNSENHYFYTQQSESFPSLSDIIFESTTNVKLKDTRTLLGRELPGLSIYNTEIAVAGKGTNLTNLPIESGPPLDIYLKEREIDEEHLKQYEEDEKKVNPLESSKEKVVYIYHSHSWEAFLPLIKGATKPDEAVSSNQKVNVIAVGDILSKELINKGIGVEHNTENVAENLRKRHLDYYSSYKISREKVKEAMVSNEKLKILIDIHRDSQRKDITTTEIKGENYARLFFVVGKEHKNFERNLKFAKEVNKEIENKYPGLSRGVFVKGKAEGNGIYNQDIMDQSLLVEFGGVDNNFIELSNTIKAFSEVFSEIYWKAEEVNG